MAFHARRFPILTAALCLTLAFAATLAIAGGFRAASLEQDANTASDPTQEMPLKQRMSRVNDLLRTVVRSLNDPQQRDATLKAIGDIQNHIVAAKQYPAPGLDQQPADAQQAWADEYRRSLAELLLETARLEMLILEGKTDEANQHIRTTMIRLRDQAHERFQVD